MQYAPHSPTMSAAMRLMKRFALLLLVGAPFTPAKALCQDVGVLGNIQVGVAAALAHTAGINAPDVGAAGAASIAWVGMKSPWGAEIGFEYGHRRDDSGASRNELGNTVLVVRRLWAGKQHSSGTYLGVGYGFSDIGVGLHTGGTKVHGVVASLGQRIALNRVAVVRPELVVLRERSEPGLAFSGVTRFTLRVGLALTSPLLW